MKKWMVFTVMLLSVGWMFGDLTWCGDSFIIVNGTWYNGSKSAFPSNFHGADLSTLTVISLGAELQSYDGSGDIARLHYMIDSNSPDFINLPLVDTPWNEIWRESGVELDLSGLSEGSHSLAVWFEVIDTDPEPDVSVWDSRSSLNYVATFSIPEGALPITLASFSAAALKGAVSVTWVTESESENAHFLLYRDGEVLAQIAGAGTSTEPQSYAYTDQYVIPGRTYTYQLADVSFDGEEVKHNEVEVKVKAEYVDRDYNIGAAYPNPFNPVTVVPVNLAKEAAVTATLYDMTGRPLTELHNGTLAAGSHALKIDGANLSTGIYFVRIAVNDEMQVQKIALMK